MMFSFWMKEKAGSTESKIYKGKLALFRPPAFRKKKKNPPAISAMSTKFMTIKKTLVP